MSDQPFWMLPDGIGKVTLLDWMPHEPMIISSELGPLDQGFIAAARISYGQYGLKTEEKDIALLERMMREGHNTPFEQAQLQFMLDMPIMVARQLMRYRAGHWLEQSRRYDEIDGEEDFYVPRHWRVTNGATPEHVNEMWAVTAEKHIAKSVDLYRQYLAVGAHREQARLVIPAFALRTKVLLTIDFRNFLHMVEERTSRHAQYETRETVKAMWELVKPLAPATMKLWLAQPRIEAKELEITWTI
jgi:thymidylate synthase (FAD)